MTSVSEISGHLHAHDRGAIKPRQVRGTYRALVCFQRGLLKRIGLCPVLISVLFLQAKLMSLFCLAVWAKKNSKMNARICGVQDV